MHKLLARATGVFATIVLGLACQETRVLATPTTDAIFGTVVDAAGHPNAGVAVSAVTHRATTAKSFSVAVCHPTLPDGTLAPGPYSAYVIGTDFPLVEAGPPANVLSSPTLTGAGGTSDLTVSGINTITE